MEKLSGGDMLIRALQDEGVEYVFGYPGGAVLHIYDAFLSKTGFNMFWCDMSRLLPIWRTVMHVLQADRVSCL